MTFPSPGRSHPGLTVWFTGLSSSGKTTLAQCVSDRLSSQEYKVQVLDGDILRQRLCSDLGFTRQDRDMNVRRLGFVAELLTRHGVVVLVAAIAPFRDTRHEVKSLIGDFLEVYVNAPLTVCEQRDVKGLYRKARAGEIRNFAGIDDPYEPPLNPDIECRTDLESIEQSTGKVLKCVLQRIDRRHG